MQILHVNDKQKTQYVRNGTAIIHTFIHRLPDIYFIINITYIYLIHVFILTSSKQVHIYSMLKQYTHCILSIIFLVYKISRIPCKTI